MRYQWHHMHRACGVIDTASIFNFFCIPSLFCIWFSLFEVVRKIFGACGVNDTACILKNSNIFANSNLYSNQEPKSGRNGLSYIIMLWFAIIYLLCLHWVTTKSYDSPNRSQSCAMQLNTVAVFGNSYNKKSTRNNNTKRMCGNV
jgi:hypothetical protein